MFIGFETLAVAHGNGVQTTIAVTVTAIVIDPIMTQTEIGIALDTGVEVEILGAETFGANKLLSGCK